MDSNAQFVSRVVNAARAVTKDDHISRRYVLQVGRSKVSTYISQKLADRSLYRESNLYQTLKCFELKTDDIVNCDIVQFRRCKQLVKSKHKLPQLIYSKYGSSILRVTSVDDGTEIDMASLSEISSESRREFGGKFLKYYVHNDYVYIPNSTLKGVNVEVLSLDEKGVRDVSGCKDESEDCKSVWEYKFICPDKLYEPIVQETLSEVINFYKRIQQDESPNLNNNEK